ncbi:MAG: DUF882 domain-containing protein [Labilithrix sp.]|nr:DUF882 domain-containing protein [Labilithrix sp.]MCW5812382.1 DUF882 domain-containing protein [Labilithrix sp.]
MHRLGAALAATAAALVATPSAVDAHVSGSNGLAVKKARAETLEPPPLLATLVQTHTDERVPLDDESPSAARFAELLADRVTGERHAFDPRLLELLRSLAKRHPGARIELVSGYRSAKLNEMMRKKGHHVASHSQHSLGHAVDFRIVPPDAELGLEPLLLEQEIRALGWEGGVGTYSMKYDWFVHADVGPRRRWSGT